MSRAASKLSLSRIENLVSLAILRSRAPNQSLQANISKAQGAIDKVRNEVNPTVNKEFSDHMRGLRDAMSRATSEYPLESLCLQYGVREQDAIRLLSDQTWAVLADTSANLNVGYGLRVHQFFDASLGRSEAINKQDLAEALNQNGSYLRSLVKPLAGRFEHLTPDVPALDMAKFSQLEIPQTLGRYIVSAGTTSAFADQVNRGLTQVVSPEESKKIQHAYSLYQGHLNEVDKIIAGFAPFALVDEAHQELFKAKGVQASDAEVESFLNRATEKAISGAKQEWQKTGDALQTLASERFEYLVTAGAELQVARQREKPNVVMKTASIVAGATMRLVGDIFGKKDR